MVGSRDMATDERSDFASERVACREIVREDPGLRESHSAGVALTRGRTDAAGLRPPTLRAVRRLGGLGQIEVGEELP